MSPPRGSPRPRPPTLTRRMSIRSHQHGHSAHWGRRSERRVGARSPGSRPSLSVTLRPASPRGRPSVQHRLGWSLEAYGSLVEVLVEAASSGGTDASCWSWRAICGMGVRLSGSADEAVRAVRILQEVLGVAARISTPMLWKEHAVRVICPTRTSLPNVIGAEALRKVSTVYCTANVFDEPAHEPSVASTPPVAPIGRRQMSILLPPGGASLAIDFLGPRCWCSPREPAGQTHDRPAVAELLR